MRILTRVIVFSSLLISGKSLAQSGQEQEKYHKFAIYAGAGPSFYFNNLVMSKNEVNTVNYSFSARFMWEPQHSLLGLGIETGYFRLYTVNSTNPKADIKNSSIPLQFVVSMRFSKQFYAYWSMGQSILKSKVSNTDSSYNFNSSIWSLSDFSATIGYRFIDKPKISYAAEFKGYYSSKYEDANIALLFIIGFKL